MAPASASTVPSGSISTGTSPAGLSARNSGRRSHHLLDLQREVEPLLLRASRASCARAATARNDRECAWRGGIVAKPAAHCGILSGERRRRPAIAARRCARLPRFTGDREARPSLGAATGGMMAAMAAISRRFSISGSARRHAARGLVQGRSRLRRRAARAFRRAAARAARGRARRLGGDGVGRAGAGAAARPAAAQPQSRPTRRLRLRCQGARRSRACRRARLRPRARRRCGGNSSICPFEHSEDLADQEEGVRLFASLPEGAFRDNCVDYARRHHAIIARFGRFPHRNARPGPRHDRGGAGIFEGPGAPF